MDAAARTDPATGPAGPRPDDPLAGRVPRRPLLLGLLRTLFTATFLLVVYFVLPLNREFSAATLAALAAGVLAVGVLVAWQVRSIMRSRHPGLRAVESIALSLPLFLLFFAETYVVLSTTDQTAFSEPLTRIDSLYFVVTVVATVGFGDIAPVSELARVLVTLQMVGDLVLIGLVLRVFVSAVNRRRQAAGQPDATAGPGG